MLELDLVKTAMIIFHTFIYHSVSLCFILVIKRVNFLEFYQEKIKHNT